MSAARVLVVSDTHLSPCTPEAADNLAAVIAHDRRAPADVVVHLGDIVVDGPGNADELASAHALLSAFGDRFRVIPGNHDVGDGPHAAVTDPDELIDERRLGRYRDLFGADRWRTDVGAWTLLGLNAQLFDSGLDDEAEQWSWLESELDAAGAPGRPVVLCVHKPVVVPDPADTGGHAPERYVPMSAAARIAGHLATGTVRLVLTGHVHQQRQFTNGATTHVWVPSAWGVIPESVQPTLGIKQCGIVELDLHDDGRFAVRFVQPAGFRQIEIGTDVVNPYAPRPSADAAG